MDVWTDEEVECTVTTWELLPSHKRLLSGNEHYIQGFREKCENCDGTGEVERPESDYDEFWDEDEAIERYYKRKYGEY